MKKSGKKQWISKNFSDPYKSPASHVSKNKMAEHYTLREFKKVIPHIGVKKNNHIVSRKINHILRTEPDDKFRADEIKQWKKLLK